MVSQTINKRVHRKFGPISIIIDIINQGARVIRNSGKEVDRTDQINGS
jgi:hypothetical protein